MIPADVADTAARTRLLGDLLTRPVSSPQKIADALSDYTPGQRMMATIEALLPNGAYRAMIAQREITLALPFAAKPGDALELEVVETQGRLAFAVVAGAKPAAEGAENASVATRLTVTGRLIADLLAGLDKEAGKRPQPAPLNNAQAVLERPPTSASGVAAALQTALAKSGMFYEAHQARWLTGQLGLASLLQEPQGQLSPALHALVAAGGGRVNATATGTANAAATVAASAALPPAAAAADGAAGAATGAAAQSAGTAAGVVVPADAGAVRVGMNQMIAPSLGPLVQQQLEALATQCYVWQGQIWPGQQMNWEIVEEEGERRAGSEENTAANWTTHLALTLPNLGGIAATLRLVEGKRVEIVLRAEQEATRRRLTAANAPLREQFQTAGLNLTAFSVSRHVAAETADA